MPSTVTVSSSTTRPATALPAAGRIGAAAERALLDRWHATGDESARTELVERFMPFVRRIATGFAGRGEPLEDLIQVGSVGLLNAIDRFDVSRGLRLTTFAAPNISGEIKRHFRDRSWAMRVPRSIQELYAAVSRLNGQFASEHGRSPTVMELARALETSEEQILEAVEAGRNYRAASLDAPASGEDDSPRGEALGVCDPGFAGVETRAELRSGLAALEDRERQIILLRYSAGLSQRDIADRVGLSQMHVSRLLRKAVAEMRAAMHVCAEQATGS